MNAEMILETITCGTNARSHKKKQKSLEAIHNFVALQLRSIDRALVLWFNIVAMTVVIPHPGRII